MPCRGDPRFVFADAKNVPIIHIPELLAMCQRCPYRAACISTVLPGRFRFDGVCGGRVWINGTVRDECEGAEPDELNATGIYIPHGTEAGARAHNRRGEPPCLACRQAARAATARRRAGPKNH